MRIWRIECILKENFNNEDDVIKEMATKIHEKFKKYWYLYSVVLVFGAILDRRMKLQVLKLYYTKLDPYSS